MITEEKVFAALKNVFDPEIPVNVVDLGLIYDVKVEGGKVAVKMTLTAPGCPMHTTISQSARDAILQVEGVEDAQVDVVWDPPWNPDMMTPEAREQLGLD